MAKILTLLLGTLAILTRVPTIFFIISLAIIVRETDETMSNLAIAASILAILSLGLFLAVLRQTHKQERDETIRSRSKVAKGILALAGTLGVSSSILIIAALAWMQSRIVNLPATALSTPKQSYLTAAFVVWGISSFLQALVLFRVVLAGRLGTREANSLRAVEETRIDPEKQQNLASLMSSLQSQNAVSNNALSAPSESRKRSTSDTTYSFASKARKRSASDPRSSNSSTGRKRSTSDTMSSIRSSITHVIRPTSSKTRLISQKSSYRATSSDSGTCEREIVDGFDSWDTSAVDPQSRQFFMSTANSTSNSSPNAGRFLETIPASPTGSRSPSPGFPLDLQPPSRPKRARSQSPATSFTRNRRPGSATSPVGDEAHIHPLFRTDSPTPPPSATPGTVVTAAPGAGQLITDRRSLHRMRSESLRSIPSPLVHSKSMDDIVRTSDDCDNESSKSISPPEREMTPPIPEWIMSAGPRSSLSGYSRRKAQLGLGPVGEVRES